VYKKYPAEVYFVKTKVHGWIVLNIVGYTTGWVSRILYRQAIPRSQKPGFYQFPINVEHWLVGRKNPATGKVPEIALHLKLRRPRRGSAPPVPLESVQVPPRRIHSAPLPNGGKPPAIGTRSGRSPTRTDRKRRGSDVQSRSPSPKRSGRRRPGSRSPIRKRGGSSSPSRTRHGTSPSRRNRPRRTTP